MKDEVWKEKWKECIAAYGYVLGDKVTLSDNRTGVITKILHEGNGLYKCTVLIDRPPEYSECGFVTQDNHIVGRIGID
jgi:hypothetical protein